MSGDQLHVRGGHGGTRFGWDQLLLAAALLDGSAGDIHPVTRRIVELGVILGPGAALSPPTHYALSTDLEDARRSLMAAMVELQILADLVRISHETYFAADSYLDEQVHLAKSQVAHSAGGHLGLALAPLNPLAMAGTVGLQAGGGLLYAEAVGYRGATEDAINVSPEYAGGLIGLPPGMLNSRLQTADKGGSAERPLALSYATWVRAAGTLTGMTDSGRLDFRHVSSIPAGADTGSALRRTPNTVSDMMSGVRNAYTAPDEVKIREVETMEGRKVWIVDIPGTQDWSPDSASVYDVEGAVGGLALAEGPAGAAADTGQDTAALAEEQRQATLVMELVQQAMADAGVAADEAVILNGHSAGGIHAAALASDPAFLARYDVQFLHVAGAPIAHFDVGSNVKVLALEHVDDVPSGLDGAANPDLPNWTTVTSTAGTNELVDPAARVGQAHDIGRYVEQAGQVDQLGQPSAAAQPGHISAAAHTAALAAVIPSVAKVTVHTYRGTDAVYPRADRRRVPAPPLTAPTSTVGPRIVAPRTAGPLRVGLPRLQAPPSVAPPPS